MESDLANVRRELEQERTRRVRDRRVALGLTALVGAAAFVLVLLTSHAVHGAAAVVALILGAAFLALLGVRVAVGQRWGGEILNWVSFLLGVAGVVLAVVLAPH